MRIAGTHQGAAILEDLDVLDPTCLLQFQELLHPHVDHFANFAHGHPWNRQIVPWRETDHAANSRFGLRHQQTCIIFTLFRNIRQQAA